LISIKRVSGLTSDCGSKRALECGVPERLFGRPARTLSADRNIWSIAHDKALLIYVSKLSGRSVIRFHNSEDRVAFEIGLQETFACPRAPCWRRWLCFRRHDSKETPNSPPKRNA
jgi:hypothetical protein